MGYVDSLSPHIHSAFPFVPCVRVQGSSFSSQLEASRSGRREAHRSLTLELYGIGQAVRHGRLSSESSQTIWKLSGFRGSWLVQLVFGDV
jgi:hypothetical protein